MINIYLLCCLISERKEAVQNIHQQLLDDLRTKQNMLRAQQSHDNDKLDKDQTKEVAAAEEQKKRLEAAEQEKQRLEAVEQEKQRLAAEQEKKRLKAVEQEKQRLEAVEQEKQRLAAEQEKQRLKAVEQEKQRLEAVEQEKKRLAAEQEKKRLEAAEQESQTYTVSATVASDLVPTANLLFGSRALSFDDALINALNYGSETGSSDLLSLTDESSDNSSTGNKIIVVIQV